MKNLNIFLTWTSPPLLAACSVLSPTLPALTRDCDTDSFEYGESCGAFNIVRSHPGTLTNTPNYPFLSYPLRFNGVELAQTSTLPRPTGFWGSAGDQSVVLNWTAMAAATSWEFRYKRQGQDWDDWTAVPSSSASTTGYTVPNLAKGVSYTFQVRAVNSDGTPGTASIEVTVMTLQAALPARPSGTSVKPGDQEVVLRWNAIAAATGWEYRQKVGTTYVGGLAVI